MYPPHSRNKKKRRRGRRSRRCGVSVANWPANKPHIHSATFNQRPLSRPDPGQGRAATDSDTCANSHFMATPGHQSLLLPCIPYITYRRHRLRSTLARRTQDELFRLLSNGVARVKVHGPSTVDHGPWLMGHGTMCRCHPTTGTHPCAVAFLSPLSHQIPKWSPQRPMIT